MTATLSDITDWAEKTVGIGDPGKKSGIVILPRSEGKFTVYFHEHCAIDDSKHRMAIIQEGWRAMTALMSFFHANKVDFAMFIDGTQPKFTVNAKPYTVVRKDRLNYFYALHRDTVMRHYKRSITQDFQERMTDDGR